LYPTIDRTAFPNTPPTGTPTPTSFFQSSTYYDSNMNSTVAIDFGNGNVAGPPSSGGTVYYYRCVR
jgi:hypothetical protein